jgi:hypothetical protein
MLYYIVLENGEFVWMNERIIQEIRPNKDGGYILTHFNGTEILIKYFRDK